MQREGFVPYTSSYNAAINACEKLFDDMRCVGPESSLGEYYEAVNVCDKSPARQALSALFLSMRREGLEPDTNRYKAAIEAYDHVFEWKALLALFSSLIRVGLKPHTNHSCRFVA